MANDEIQTVKTNSLDALEMFRLNMSMKVVEEQEKMFMATVKNIAGEQFEEYTVDEGKVKALFLKQIKRPPIDANYRGVKIPLCPNCTRTVSEKANWNFCGYCGQALDWSTE